jgi:soluble lytic murein transglycosylase-like protein
MRKVNSTAKAVALVIASCGACSAQVRPSSFELPTRRAAFYAHVYRVPEELVDAIIEVESGWNPSAVSNKGAVGLMQLMPGTAARFGVSDRFDVEQNLRGGIAYLAWLIHLFNGDFRLAVGAYQAGEARILVRGLAYSSPEVFAYVRRVAQLYRAARLERRKPQEAELR